MKNKFITKIKRGIYKSFLTFMVCLSLAANPALTNEIKKMFEFLNEVRMEQMVESEDDEDEPED